MNKKIAIMLLALATNVLANTTSMAMFGGEGMFDDLFKNLDFEKLSKDMESILQEMDEKPGVSAKSVQPTPAEQRAHRASDLPMKDIQPKILKTDRKSLFLDALVVDQDKQDPRAKATYIFPKIKEEAYNYYLSKLVNGLKSIEKKIDSSLLFSPAFKEEFVRYKKHIDDIVVSDGIIRDRRLYLRAFFLPQFNAFREKIFTTIPALEHLDNRVTNFLKKEEKDTTKKSKILIEFAKKPKAKIQEALAQSRTIGGTRKGAQPKDGKINIKKKNGLQQQRELELIPPKTKPKSRDFKIPHLQEVK